MIAEENYMSKEFDYHVGRKREGKKYLKRVRVIVKFHLKLGVFLKFSDCCFEF